jgi:hypothetical protein
MTFLNPSGLWMSMKVVVQRIVVIHMAATGRARPGAQAADQGRSKPQVRVLSMAQAAGESQTML